MKEATGELSTTAIAIVAIGLILAIFTAILLPTLRSQIALNQACNSGPGFVGEKVCCDGTTTKCTGTPTSSKECDGGRVGASSSFSCHYYDGGVPAGK